MWLLFLQLNIILLEKGLASLLIHPERMLFFVLDFFLNPLLILIISFLFRLLLLSILLLLLLFPFFLFHLLLLFSSILFSSLPTDNAYTFSLREIKILEWSAYKGRIKESSVEMLWTHSSGKFLSLYKRVYC